MRNLSLRVLLPAVVLLLGLVGVGVYFALHQQRPLGKLDEGRARAGLPRKVAQLLNQSAALQKLSPVPEASVYVVLRSQGERVAGGWFTADDAQLSLIDAVDELTRDKPDREAKVDAIEVCLMHDERSESPDKKSSINNIHRGVRGISMRVGEKEEKVCSTEMISSNRDFANVEKNFRKHQNLSEDDYLAQAKVKSFDTYQFLIELQPRPVIKPMFRGNTVIPMADVNAKHVQGLADGLTRWLTSQVQPDGREVYRWLPSRGEEPDDNNMIRQFMATVCLVRLANANPSPELEELAKRNLRYNLDHFYADDDGFGLIRWKDVRLGAIALAALAIAESPFRKEFESYELALRKSTESMQRADGSYQTFWGSESRDNQNYYPGETLLFWSTLYDQAPDPALMEKIQRSFKYYRTWHRENRNPAFIPWHVQAYVKLLLKKDDPEMRDFVFEMSDWLEDMQQWDSAEYPDFLGRFYNPKHPEFGPSHASSTAVYLEGYIDAYRLAVHVGDKTRAEKYKRIIKRGLRSLMQIQYTDDIDMFYIHQKDRVLGGLRTTEADNSIRVDNVQHALMGLQRILRTFNAEGSW
jgi:hypothetical protein